LQLIWGNAVFVSVVARVFTLSFVPGISGVQRSGDARGDSLIGCTPSKF